MTDTSKQETDRLFPYREGVRCALLISLCYFLTSTGWILWEHHLAGQVPARMSDITSMVAGYVLQAAGVGVFALLLRSRPSLSRKCFYAALLLHAVCLIPAVLSESLAGTLIFGLLMNLFCGVIAGCYLYDLAEKAAEERKAGIFGAGYGLAILASWFLSLLKGGSIYHSRWMLFVCLLLTVFIGLFVLRSDREGGETEERPPGNKISPELGRFLLLAGGLVLLFSMVKNSGFSFPATDIRESVNLELSRLCYAAGLILAGVVTDRSRKYSAICALAALVTPFLLLALQGEQISSVFFWVLGYFTFGFYSVYRIILFSDLALKNDALFLSGFGLLFGRLGDAAGEGLCIALTGRLTLLICVTALLFLASVFVFFRVYQHLYLPLAVREKNERERFHHFAAQHDLSPREREVLRLLLEQRTNLEIAADLFVSESTVKFHIHNLLKKTGCRNRMELMNLYATYV